MKELYSRNKGSIPRADQAKLLIKNITNLIAGLIGMVAVLMYIYGGYLYVSRGGGKYKQSKKVLINATVGMLSPVERMGS